MNRLILKHLKKGTSLFVGPFFILTVGITYSSCSLMEKRPVQDMADTISALKAAKEVNADSLAPELYRQAIEAYARSKNEYRFKNFGLAKIYAQKSRRFAEEAEYQSIQQGANRSSLNPADEPPPPPPPTPEAPVEQKGTPAFLLEEPTKGAPPPPATPPSAPSAPTR